MEHSTPTRVADRYELVRPIGSGGTAEVYLADDLHLGRPVALKLFHGRIHADAVLAARVSAEVSLVSGLAHPSIVRVLDVVRDERYVGIALEYLGGGDLRSRLLRRGGLYPEEVAAMARALLDALAHAHARGVVHRDVKPRNVLFADDGSARLSDFGLARSSSSAGLSETDSVAGTAEYTAPETVTAGIWDARSDLYALGCTLFEALTGSPPFVANAPARVLRMHVEEPSPELPASVAEANLALAILVGSLLAKDPNDRPQTAAEARACLDDRALAEARLGSGATDRRLAVRVACPTCGAPMSPHYPWCFSCRTPNVPLVAQRRGGWSVVVRGPGRAGDKLPAELRDRCIRVARSKGLEPMRLEKNLPRVPFVLASGLERASAEQLVSELEAHGFPGELGGPSFASRRATWGALARKSLVMAPRLYAVAATMTGGFYQILFRAPLGVSLGLVGVALAGIPVVSALVYARPLALVRGETDVRTASELVELVARVRDPLVHARVRSIVEAGRALEAAVANDASLPEDFVRDASQAVAASIRRAARLGLALDDVLGGRRYASHARLLATRDASEGDARRAAEAVRETDTLYTRTLELIGALALELHELSLRLARASVTEVRRELAGLSDRLVDLGDLGSAWRELEEEASSGT